MSKTVNGKIIKGVAGSYDVYVEDLGILFCKAKGLFRHQKLKPLVGDMVLAEIIDEDKAEGQILEILPRKNTLIRPATANIDQAMVVFAAAEPEPHLNLLDRFLILMEQQNIPVLIVFNKNDLASEEYVSHLRHIYDLAGFKTFSTRAKEGIGCDEVRKALIGKTTVLAGPSGVGKSTFMNLMQPEAGMETGELSEKIKRGKNTTRHTELIYLEKDTYLLDTPGFSSLYVMGVEPQDLGSFYPEFRKFEPECRFALCSHIAEPDCGVKNALQKGLIAEERYENYKKIYEEIKNTRRY